MQKWLFAITIMLGTAPAVAAATARAETVLLGSRLNGVFAPGGDSDGYGTFLMELDTASNRACYTLTTRRIGIASGGTIQLLVPLRPTPPVLLLDVTGPRNDTCTVLPAEVTKQIAANPREFYVSVRNQQFPRDALRGKLARM